MKRFIHFLLVLGAVPFLAVAQDTTGVSAGAEASFFADFPLEEVFGLVVAVLTPIIVWITRKLPTKDLPSWSLPLLSGTLIPWIINLVTGLANGPDLAYWQVSLYGLLGVGLRELLDQLKKAPAKIKAGAAMLLTMVKTGVGA